MQENVRNKTDDQKKKKRKIKKMERSRVVIKDLNDMVSEISFLSFLSGSVFNIEDADEISCPATHQAIKELE